VSEALEGVPLMPSAPVRPRDAALGVPYRRGPQGVEVFWVKRERTLRFGGGFYTFPGGKVDAADAAVPVAGAGPEGRLIAAAARELFEESGLLKAEGAERLSQEALDGLRRALLDETLPFERLLAEQGLSLRAADFLPAGRWVTPPDVPIRFDARFFLVEAPPGQLASVWPGELESGEWILPSLALARWEEATSLLHPPALHTLQVMAGFVDAASASSALQRFRFLGPGFVTHRVEFQRGVQLMALKTPTLPPAAHTFAYVLGTGECLVVDPGSPDDAETDQLVALLRLQPELKPLAVVLTHHHADHVGGAVRAATQLGVPVWAHALTASRLPFPVARLLEDGEVLALAGPLPMRWRVLHTPGHAPGHVTLLDERTRSAVVGDMVSGFGTIVIDPPEGDMAEYLRQLERLQGLVRCLYPAHGPMQPDGPAKLEEYLVHRRWREGRVLEALRGAAAPATLEALVPLAYDDVAAFVWPIAERTTHAILLKLLAEGQVARSGEAWRAVS
jgi:glyoxylase-like metal-dependent hydrolase (beta-lactamase superfamily II)/8-oxo-dGTP pyrophosphatase MutT (NUDIX family)